MPNWKNPENCIFSLFWGYPQKLGFPIEKLAFWRGKKWLFRDPKKGRKIATLGAYFQLKNLQKLHSGEAKNWLFGGRKNDPFLIGKMSKNRVEKLTIWTGLEWLFGSQIDRFWTLPNFSSPECIFGGKKIAFFWPQTATSKKMLCLPIQNAKLEQFETRFNWKIAIFSNWLSSKFVWIGYF